MDLTKPRPRLAELFVVFLGLGVQSFGGGSSTLYLIHQACIARGWLDEGEFLHAWSMVQIAPGINLVKLAILIGFDLRGWPGMITAVAGMLLPSAALTVLMTAGFSVVSRQPLVQAAMKGVLPATIGLSLAMAVQMGQPMLSRGHQEGLARLGVHILILGGAALLMAVNGISPVVVLLLSGSAAALLLWILPAKAPEKDPSAQPEEKTAQ